MAGSFKQLERELRSFIERSLASASLSIDSICYSVFGLAGVDTKQQHRIISDILKRLGFVDFILANDAFLGVLAAAPMGCGICAVNGTGASLAAIDEDGKMLQVGGMGDWTGDGAGSGWYGVRVARAVYDSFFRLGPQTLMSEMLFKELGVKRPEDFIEAVMDSQRHGLSPSDFNHILFLAADCGDELAVRMLARSAEKYASGIAYIANAQRFSDSIHIVLSGSVFVKEKCQILPKLLEDRAKEMLHGRGLKFIKLMAPPVSGAVVWALKGAGVDADPHAVQKECLNKEPNLF
jgi:N-acetylglucosamine kinase-like BadF-type ATPase